MAHKFKIMVIDDCKDEREETYISVLSHLEIEPIFVWNREQFYQHINKETPFDGYLIDIFLDQGDWEGTDASQLIKNYIQKAPRSAPIFLVSKRWDDPKVLNVLKQTGESTAKVVQYLAWTEFIDASYEDENSYRRRVSLLNKILFELKRWHGQSGFSPEPDETIRILLLADLQYGDPKEDPQANFVEHLIARELKKERMLPHLIMMKS